MIGSSGVIRVGSRVCVRDTDDRVEFDIVEPHEADIADARVSCEPGRGSLRDGDRGGRLIAAMADRPRRVSVRYRGVPYSLNLVLCRRALVECQVKGEFESMVELAARVGVSRSTASRFFSGRPTSLTVTKRILDALHLKFEDVLTPESEDDAA